MTDSEPQEKLSHYHERIRRQTDMVQQAVLGAIDAEVEAADEAPALIDGGKLSPWWQDRLIEPWDQLEAMDERASPANEVLHYQQAAAWALILTAQFERGTNEDDYADYIPARIADMTHDVERGLLYSGTRDVNLRLARGMVGAIVSGIATGDPETMTTAIDRYQRQTIALLSSKAQKLAELPEPDKEL